MINLEEFYGVFGKRAARAYAQAPQRYLTRELPNGLLSYDVLNFDTIKLKLLAGDLKTLRDLIHPLRECNLLIDVPQSLESYINDLESLGFRVVAEVDDVLVGENLLLMKRFGDTNGS